MNFKVGLVLFDPNCGFVFLVCGDVYTTNLKAQLGKEIYILIIIFLKNHSGFCIAGSVLLVSVQFYGLKPNRHV